MNGFYFSLIVMLGVAAIIALWPLLCLGRFSKKKIGILIILLIVMSVSALGLYDFLGAAPVLQQKMQIEKAAKIKDEWGSVEQITEKLKQQLMMHSDSKGWYLLGKLYLHQMQLDEAAWAFEQGGRLAPQDAQLKQAYQQCQVLKKQAAAAEKIPGIVVNVSMPDKVKQRFSPETVVFVLLKINNRPMPLAAVKEHVSDLPLTLKFTDQSLLLPGTHLTRYQAIDVIARTALSGTPTPVYGDVQGEKRLKNWRTCRQPVKIIIKESTESF
ncbi:MAG: hypothetical protein HY939_07405 [Gammaproteobacteria bacterium]|nr:hypothetical protein [Gammaproteobacteria bacterium]